MVKERRVARNVVERYFDVPVYALRFTAYGKRQYVTLGTRAEGWNDKRAIEERDNVLADVRRNRWVPPDRNRPRERASSRSAAAVVKRAPGFSAFARRRLEARRGRVSRRTSEHDEWALTHLEPFFTHTPIDEIDVEMVDAYSAFKVKQARERADAIIAGRPFLTRRGDVHKPLSAASINDTIAELQSILQLACDYRIITDNPAAGRRRRLAEPPRRPVHLDSADQIQALLDAAGILDRQKRFRINDRKAAISTLVFAGPRANELCDLRRRDVDLAGNFVETGSKTPAGMREIEILPILRPTLKAQLARYPHAGPDAPLFPNAAGGRRDKDNLRNRVLAPVIEVADALLLKRGQRPLPKGLTPHKLRHTFASILVACGVDVATVMYLLGHTDPKFTLRVYTHMMKRSPHERARLRALVYCQPHDSSRHGHLRAAA
jgi:integrase